MRNKNYSNETMEVYCLVKESVDEMIRSAYNDGYNDNKQGRPNACDKLASIVLRELHSTTIPTLIEDPTCTWVQSEEGAYETTCGKTFFFEDGSATENDVKYCHFCGKRIIDDIYTYDLVEDDDA